MIYPRPFGSITAGADKSCPLDKEVTRLRKLGSKADEVFVSYEELKAKFYVERVSRRRRGRQTPFAQSAMPTAAYRHVQSLSSESQWVWVYIIKLYSKRYFVGFQLSILAPLVH